MLQATPQILDDLDCYLPDKNATKKIARFFALFSDPSRVRLLSALAIAPLCVSDISAVLKMNQTTVSHQLRILRDMDVVSCEREGKILKYKISNPKINEILLVGVEYLGF
ncbi:transcriptional regulator ArsR family [Corallococcus sp. CAG:1435]|uniref:Helix-turn-helix transcriptional regulator n=1 Tax=Candidatus Fimimonas gallinarum TaxID=2840821 RepID=A0A9D1E3D5_9BACT|nr:transcriptional regulator ArsR family [Corallococcus sp. CAG:1435]HIR65628.1 helix-turn-helix transcriptional regulator [Candidatus Fimimonas gallinarum]